jgi:hypothetical protein
MPRTRLWALITFSVPQLHRHNHSAPLLLPARFRTTNQPNRRPANSFALAQPQLNERPVKRLAPITALSVPQSHRHNHIALRHLLRPACRSTCHRPKRRLVRSLVKCRSPFRPSAKIDITSLPLVTTVVGNRWKAAGNGKHSPLARAQNSVFIGI